MILSQYHCPNCNLSFNDNLMQKQYSNNINLDKQYNYFLIEVNCSVCNKDVKIFVLEQLVVLWTKEQQYNYNKFVKNKNYNILKNKRFLYFYYPLWDQNIINKIIKAIDLNKIDAIILPQFFYNKLKIKLQKQCCIIPDYLFESVKNTVFPNYFIQQLILREMEKFQDSIIYSTYNTFLNKFNILFKQKNWNVVNNKIIQLIKE